MSRIQYANHWWPWRGLRWNLSWRQHIYFLFNSSLQGFITYYSSSTKLLLSLTVCVFTPLLLSLPLPLPLSLNSATHQWTFHQQRRYITQWSVAEWVRSPALASSIHLDISNNTSGIATLTYQMYTLYWADLPTSEWGNCVGSGMRQFLADEVCEGAENRAKYF